MFTHLRLENFKSWRELDIDLAPVTILFGTNSSGKSSILQSILLLLQSYETQGIDYIDFGGGRGDYVDLGGFQQVVFNHDLTKSIKIYFNYAHRYSKEFEIVMQYKDDNTEITDRSMSESLWDFFGNELQIFKGAQSYLSYLGPIRQNAQRSYLWSGSMPHNIEADGENTLAILTASSRSEENNSLLENVSKWLNHLELTNEFNINPLDESKRFYETIVKIGEIQTSLKDVGFGISQVLPVITLLFFAREYSTILLEQPELHLHPRAQAHLADLILHVAEERKLQLIVESHSEHLLRRLQRRIAEVEHEFASPENVKMYFCDTGENGSTIQSVEVDEYGQIQNWPHNFFGDITGDLEAMTMAALQRSMNAES